MSKIIKNLLTGALTIMVLILSYAVLSYVNSYSKMIQPSSFRSFSVIGKAKVNTIPNIAKFNFQIITEGGNDMKSLQTKNTKAANKVLTFLKSKGIKDQDIKTQFYNISPRYQTVNCKITNTPLTTKLKSFNFGVRTCPPPSIVGYTIAQSINVKIRDFSKIGEIMSGIVKNGANRVSALSFTIDDLTKIQSEARTKAIYKAKAQANSIAAAGGFKVGKLLSIQENSGYPIYTSSLIPRGINAKLESESTPPPIIKPGSQEVNVTVTLRYEIE